MRRTLPFCALSLILLSAIPLGCGKKPGLTPPDYSIKPTATRTPGGPCGYSTGWFFAAGTEGWAVAWTEDKAAPTPTPTCGIAYPGVCFPVTVTHDSIEGSPAPGSLRLDMGFTRAGQQAHFSRALSSPINLTGSAVCVHLKLDSGGPVTAKVFVKTGGSYLWANGPEVALTVGEWSQAAMNPDSPSWNAVGYNPGDVREIGVALTTSSASFVTAHLDSWSYSTPPTATPTWTRTPTRTPTPDPFATPTATATSTSTPLRSTFDAGLGGWAVSWTEAKAPATPCATGTAPFCFPVTLSFDAATGDPSPGSASVTLLYNAVSQEAHLQTNVPDLNLAGRTVQARVRLDSGDARAKLYLKTGSGWVWGSGPETALTAGVWTTVTLNASSPDFQLTGYDPALVKAAGLVLVTGATAVPSNVHFDSWTY